MDNITNIRSLDPFAVPAAVIHNENPNPFYIPKEGSPHRYTKTKLLSDEYRHLYVLCLNENFEPTESNKKRVQLFFEADSDITELGGQKNLVTLIQCPFSLIHIFSIRSGLIIANDQALAHFNHDANEL